METNKQLTAKREIKALFAFNLITGKPPKNPMTEEQKANFITEVRNDPELNAELEKMLEQIKPTESSEPPATPENENSPLSGEDKQATSDKTLSNDYTLAPGVTANNNLYPQIEQSAKALQSKLDISYDQVTELPEHTEPNAVLKIPVDSNAPTAPTERATTPENQIDSTLSSVEDLGDSFTGYININGDKPGLYFKEDKEKSAFKIGNNLVIDGIGEMDGVGYIFISFIDKFGEWRDLDIPMADISKLDVLTSILTANMYGMNLKHKGLFQHYFNNTGKKLRVKPVKQIGWYKNCYVMPNKIIGDNVDNIKYYGYADNECFTSKGTLQEWRDNVAELCIGKSGLELGLYCGLVGVLIPWHNEGGGINIYGDSSAGKTKTSGYVYMSATGSPKFRLNDAANPKGGFEGLCYDSNHSTLFIDELTNAKLDHLKAIPYMGINGNAPARGKQNPSIGRGYYKGRKWKTFIYSTSELSYSDCLRLYNVFSKAGEDLRLINLTGLIYAQGNDELFNELSENTLKYYGTATPSLISYITEYSPNIKQLISQEYDILISHSNTHTLQTKRVAKLFALIIVAGILGIYAGVIPDDANPRATLTSIYYKNWYCYHSVNMETQKIAERLLLEIDVNGKFIEDIPPTNGFIKTGQLYGVYDSIPYTAPNTYQPNYFIFSSGLNEIFKKSRCDIEIKKLQIAGIIKDEKVVTRYISCLKKPMKGWSLDYVKLSNLYT